MSGYPKCTLVLKFPYERSDLAFQRTVLQRLAFVLPFLRSYHR